ncbi:MAG: DUF1385 domain-containing protein [Butyrivibrio sp.]|nr:DUF1385 domain-containing protein [Butyrivibrio sp.]
MKYSGIGGQAVIEGVMMKNKDKYAIAVRKPDGKIEVKTENCNSISARAAFFRAPFIRGMVNFIDSLVLGMSTLTYSTSFYDDEEDSKKTPEEKEKSDKIFGVITVIISVILALGIFMVGPWCLSEFVLSRFIKSKSVLILIEGLVRVLLFIGYVTLISLMKDIKRVYMYHGAEHKCINCIEHGLELNVENVRKSSKEHKRCGTSFMLIVMCISILVLMLVRFDSRILRMFARILLIPIIAGISYEFLRFTGTHDNAFVNALSKPGLLLQGLTTREPDDEMIEVGIASVEAVFDWKAYIDENFKAEPSRSKKADESAADTQNAAAEEECADDEQADS